MNIYVYEERAGCCGAWVFETPGFLRDQGYVYRKYQYNNKYSTLQVARMTKYTLDALTAKTQAPQPPLLYMNIYIYEYIHM